MIDSIRMGIRAWGERESILPHDGFLVCPADHPGIKIADFNACIEQFRKDPTRIVVATRQGRRGHPIIFPADLVPFVASAACDSGLNNLPHSYADRLCLVERESEGVIRDVDTPDDFREIGNGQDLQD
jgi:molybdenum cofactor cytidylyltransferase